MVFEKCETDWFADWALNRRHLKRNRGRQSNSVQQQQQQFPDIPPPGGFDVPPRSNGSSTYPGDTGMYSTIHCSALNCATVLTKYYFLSRPFPTLVASKIQILRWRATCNLLLSPFDFCLGPTSYSQIVKLGFV